MSAHPPSAPTSPKRPLLPRKILVPTDFSAASDAAFEYALELAKCLEVDVLLMHAFHPPALDLPQGMITGSTERVFDAANSALESAAVRGRDRGVAIETSIEPGYASSIIVERAAAIDGVLVVMGTHGRTGLARGILGSVAEKVVRTAQCPVLTVSAPSDKA